MSGAGRLADIGSGHGCFAPSPVIEGSEDVFTNSRPALRKGDAVLPHSCGRSPGHKREVSAGSASVNINNRPAARIGDAISCGGSVATGSSDVFIGDDTWGTGTGKAITRARFVLSQVPGSTEHGYYNEPYKLYHNGSLVQKGLTDEHGVIEYELDIVKGNFEIEAVGNRWRLDVRALAPADTEAGMKDRLAALSYHVSDRVQQGSSGAVEEIPISLGWFQNAKSEAKEAQPSEAILNYLKAIIP